jgi:predicted DNA-binding protein (MmcQ/YjbR family)
VDAHGRDDRDLARTRAICLRFPEAEEAELQGRPLFRVRTRRFALFNGSDAPPRKRWDGFGRSLHFVTDPQDREALAQDPRFLTSPHHGNRGWMALALERDDVDWGEIAELLETAYRQVARRQLIEELDRDADLDPG